MSNFSSVPQFPRLLNRSLTGLLGVELGVDLWSTDIINSIRQWYACDNNKYQLLPTEKNWKNFEKINAPTRNTAWPYTYYFLICCWNKLLVEPPHIWDQLSNAIVPKLWSQEFCLLSAGSLHPAGRHNQGRVHGLLLPGCQDLATTLAAQPLWQRLFKVTRLVSFWDKCCLGLVGPIQNEGSPNCCFQGSQPINHLVADTWSAVR